MNEPGLATLVDLEARVWDALRRGDAAADVALLSPAFLGVYPSGTSDRQGHAAQLDGGPSVIHYEIQDPQVKWLSPTMGLLSYKASFARPRRGRQDEMYVSSIWSLEGGRWLNVFSQDTPVADE